MLTLPTLPIIAVLKTRDGVILRLADGSQTTPQTLQALQASGLHPLELEMVKYACGTTGWVTLETYNALCKVLK